MSTLRFALAAACLSTALCGIAHADELADIKKAGTINIGVFEDFPPFSSVGTDMSLHGYDVDFAEALGKQLGVKANLVRLTGQSRIAALQAHKANVLFSLGYSEERAKVLDFTKAYAPYYLAAVAPKALSMKSPADLAGKTVAVNRGTLDDSQLTAAAPASTDIRRFDSYNGVISAFLAGQVQVMVVGNDVGAAVLARKPAIEPEQKFILLSSPDHTGVNKNEPNLKAAIEAAIDKLLADGTLNKISETWLQKPLDPKDLVEPNG